MSGIVGIVHLDGQSVPPPLLESATAILTHRGPDASGTWLEGPVGLGHRHLRTTPQARHEHYPLVWDDGSLVLTADARLDNRRELIHILATHHHLGPDPGDSELILCAYLTWGEACARHLIGDFAFAIWDHSRQVLYCARDPVGVKPFYYHHNSRLFMFASEIKAVLLHPQIPHELNVTRIADHLARFHDEKTSTFYRYIHRLPPAHQLIISKDGLKQTEYWSFSFEGPTQEASREELVETFREKFITAVSGRLRSDRAVGTALSGGLDSTSIACTIRFLKPTLHLEEGINTFSAIFPSLPPADLRKIDERRYMDAVLSLEGFIPHFIHADQLDPLGDLETILGQQDEPYLGPNLFIHQAMYRSAQHQGVRAFLDGIDGDVTVSHGLELLTELARHGRLRRLLFEARAIANQEDASIRVRKLIWLFAIRPLIPFWIWNLWQNFNHWRGSNTAMFGPLRPEFARRAKLNERLKAYQQEQTRLASDPRAFHAASLQSPLIPLGLELLDKAAAAHQLEPRYPFFDRRLMTFCLALRPEVKLHQGWTRWVLRQAMDGILPKEVQWRFTKANLSPNFLRNFIGRDRPIIEKTLAHPHPFLDTIIDQRALTEAYHHYRRDPLGHEAEAMVLFSTITLNAWLNRVQPTG